MRVARRAAAVAALGILAAVAAEAAEAAAPDMGSVPSIRARDLGGKPFRLVEALESGPAVITFWATWCKPCRKELPELQKLVEKHGEQGFQVIGINGDGPVDQAKIRPYVRALGFDITVIPDPDGEIRRRFQVEVYPTTFLVDREGRIVHRQVGYRRGDETLLEGKLLEVLGRDAGSDAPSGDDSGR